MALTHSGQELDDAITKVLNDYADVSGVTATADDVVQGKTFVDANGVQRTGTLVPGGGGGTVYQHNVRFMAHHIGDAPMIEAFFSILNDSSSQMSVPGEIALALDALMPSGGKIPCTGQHIQGDIDAIIYNGDGWYFAGCAYNGGDVTTTYYSKVTGNWYNYWVEDTVAAISV